MGLPHARSVRVSERRFHVETIRKPRSETSAPAGQRSGIGGVREHVGENGGTLRSVEFRLWRHLRDDAVPLGPGVVPHGVRCVAGGAASVIDTFPVRARSSARGRLCSPSCGGSRSAFTGGQETRNQSESQQGGDEELHRERVDSGLAQRWIPQIIRNWKSGSPVEVISQSPAAVNQ